MRLTERDVNGRFFGQESTRIYYARQNRFEKRNSFVTTFVG